jgi:hypothetical protein
MDYSTVTQLQHGICDIGLPRLVTMTERTGIHPLILLSYYRYRSWSSLWRSSYCNIDITVI